MVRKVRGVVDGFLGIFVFVFLGEMFWGGIFFRCFIFRVRVSFFRRLVFSVCRRFRFFFSTVFCLRVCF